MSASARIAAAMSCPRSCSVASSVWRRSRRRRRRSRPRSCSVASSVWRRSKRRRRHLRERRARRRPRGALSLRRRASSPRAPRDECDPFATKPTAQRNFTDPESKIMKTADGSYHQCYSGQAVVDSLAQVIVVAELSDQAADQRQLQPALEQLDENLEAIGAELPDGAVLTADAGYFSEENVTTCKQHRVDPYIATGRFKHSEP